MLRSVKTHLVPRANPPSMTRLLIAATLLCGSAGFRSAHAANTVQDWNNEFLLITQQTSGNLVAGPPEVAREIAQMGEAMSDAVNAASGSTISSFAYTGGSVATADARVAAATAAYTVLSNIFTDPAWQVPISTVTSSGTVNASNVNLANNVIIPELQSFLSSQLSSLGLSSPGSCSGSTTSGCLGYNLGIAAATAVDNAPGTSPRLSGAVASIQNGLLTNVPAGSGVTPGVFVPPTARPEMFPTWGSVTPTGLTSAQVAAAQALVSGPPPLNSTAYANSLLQTECQGSSGGQSSLPGNLPAVCAAAGFGQTAAQAQADATSALFWNDPGTTTQPPGHWLNIADTAMTSQGSSLLQSARLTALLGQSMNDAGIAVWGDKYTYNLWRPITAIRDCTSSGNGVTWTNPTCDPTWSPLIVTPPHPDYLAGHPGFSGSAATVLADFFGTDSIPGGFSSTTNYYCNGGTNNFNAANQVIGCTLSGTTYYVCNATATPIFNGTQPVACSDGSTPGASCNTVTSNGVNNNSPLICPVTETYSSFSDASSGLFGAEYSRVVGGIHTPIAVMDALTVGNGIGQQVAASAGLPDVLPEPSTLSICAVSLLALARLRRQRSRQA